MGDERNGAAAEGVIYEGVAKAGLLSSIIDIKWNGFVCECRL